MGSGEGCGVDREGSCRWEEMEIFKAGVTQGVVMGGGSGQQQWRPRQGCL